MEEKIKISIPKVTLELLKKDCEDFKILKSDEKINMNAFINTLIVNYYKEFSAGEESLHNEIQTALFSVPSEYRKKLLMKSLRYSLKEMSRCKKNAVAPPSHSSRQKALRALSDL